MTRILAGLSPVAVLLLVWQGLIMAGLVAPAILPPPAAVARALLALLSGPELYENLAATLLRCLAGLAASVLIGIPLGAIMAVSPCADGFFTPLIRATYSLPKTALVPLFILWFGIGLRTEIGAVLLSALLPLTIYTYQGVQSVPRAIIWSAQAMGTRKSTLLWRILLPASLHSSLAGLRIALGFTFVIGIATEMLAANSGIGKLIFIYGETGAYPYMFAAVFALICAVYVVDMALVQITARLLRWREASSSA